MTELLNRLPLTALFVFYLAFLGWNYSQQDSDPASPVAAKRNQLLLAKNTLDMTNAKIKETEAFLQSLETKRVELQVLAKQLADMKSTISEGSDTAAFVKAVVSEANKVGLRIKGLRPLGKKDQEYYTEHSFDLGFSGAFVQVVVFLDRISNIESIVRADNVRIRRVSSPLASVVEVEGQMQLKTYRYLGTHADDVAKKSAESVPFTSPVTAPVVPATPAAATAPETAPSVTANAPEPQASAVAPPPASAPQAPPAEGESP